MPKVTCEKCGTILHRCNLKRHKQSEACQSRQAINALAQQNKVLAEQVTEQVTAHVTAQVTAQLAAQNEKIEQQMIHQSQTLIRKIDGIASYPQTIINNNHTHNHTTINQFILDTKEPLSLTSIEASVAMGMQANVLRDGAQGIAQYVIQENALPDKVHISDKSRCVVKYHEIDGGNKVVHDKGCTKILNHIFVKFGRDGEIVVDRLSDELEKYMTEQNNIGAWPDEFYDKQMTKLGSVRLQWKKASEGHNNKLRKDVAKAIVLRCQ